MDSKRTKSRWPARIALGAFLLLFIAYHIAFYPPVFQKIFEHGIARFAGGRMTATVEKASLFRGFVFKNLELRTSDTILFRADHVTLSYSMPSLLVGHVGIRDLSLIHPEVYLKKRDGKWNYEELLSSKPAEEKPRRNSIFTFVWLKLYAKLVITDLHFTLDIDDEGKKEFVEVSHFDLHAAFITRTFQEIPLDLHAINLFDTLIVGIAPKRPIEITRHGNSDISGQISMPFFLYREAGSGATEFSSRFHLDTAGLLMRQQNRTLRPMTKIYYSVAYDSSHDRLRLDRLLFEQAGDPWIDVKAGVDHVTGKMPSISLEMLQSRIHLDSLELVLAYLGVSRSLRGTASIYPLKIEGPLDNLSLVARVDGSGLGMQTGKITHMLPILRFSVDARLDAQKYFPVEQKAAEPNLAFGLFHRLLIPDLYVNYNDSILRGNVKILPGEGVQGDLVLSHLRLTPFIGPDYDAVVSGQVHMQSPESFRDMAVKAEIHLSDVRYRVDQNRSAPLEVGLSVDGTVQMHDITTYSFDRTALTAQNLLGVPVLLWRGSTVMSFGEKQSYDMQIKELRVNYGDLHSTLPGGLRYTLSPYRLYLDGGLIVSGGMSYTKSDTAAVMKTNAMVAMPGIHVDDLRVVTDMTFTKEKNIIDNISIKGLKGALDIFAKGVIQKTDKGSVPDLVANLSLSSKTLFAIHKNLAIEGGLKMAFRVQKEAVQGTIDAKDLNMEFYSDCDAGAPCHKFRLEKVNLALPIYHDMRLKTPAVLTDSPVGQTFAGAAFQGQPNLSIGSIASSHNPRGELVKDGYFYAGSLLPGREPGVGASLEYRKNVLYLKWVRYAIFRPKARSGNGVWVPDGRLEGRDVFFNLADMNASNMEFGGRIQIQDFDLEPYLPASRSNYDGVISAELAGHGRDLTNALYNSDMRLSVYRMSREFSGFATRIVMPGVVAGAIVKSALEIPSITLELQNGLVYTTIGIARKDIRSFTNVLSFFIKPTGEEIRQERIPLAQFLERAKSEAEAGVKTEEKAK